MSHKLPPLSELLETIQNHPQAGKYITPFLGQPFSSFIDLSSSPKSIFIGWRTSENGDPVNDKLNYEIEIRLDDTGIYDDAFVYKNPSSNKLKSYLAIAPKTILEFISDCERCGIDLFLTEEAYNKYLNPQLWEKEEVKPTCATCMYMHKGKCYRIILNIEMGRLVQESAFIIPDAPDFCCNLYEPKSEEANHGA